MTNQRGSSGATVTCTEWWAEGHNIKAVRKTGDQRVGEQGEWLLKNKSPALPHVFTAWDTGYVMERLKHIEPVDPLWVYAALSDHVWPTGLDYRPVPFDDKALESRLRRALDCISTVTRVYYNLDRQVMLTVEFLSMIESMYLFGDHRRSQRVVRTHGDPTLENVMLRWSSEGLVLIDPLPARLYAPDRIEMDLGKIVQSLVGYETDRYDLEKKINLDETRQFLWTVCSEEEVLMTTVLHWTIVHLLRSLPYQNDDTRLRVIEGSLARVQLLMKETV